MPAIACRRSMAPRCAIPTAERWPSDAVRCSPTPKRGAPRAASAAAPTAASAPTAAARGEDALSRRICAQLRLTTKRQHRALGGALPIGIARATTKTTRPAAQKQRAAAVAATAAGAVAVPVAVTVAGILHPRGGTTTKSPQGTLGAKVQFHATTGDGQRRRGYVLKPTGQKVWRHRPLPVAAAPLASTVTAAGGTTQRPHKGVSPPPLPLPATPVLGDASTPAAVPKAQKRKRRSKKGRLVPAADAHRLAVALAAEINGQ